MDRRTVGETDMSSLLGTDICILRLHTLKRIMNIIGNNITLKTCGRSQRRLIISHHRPGRLDGFAQRIADAAA